MISILVGLSGLLGVGVPQALTERPRAMGLALGLCALGLLGALLTPWLAYLVPIVAIGAAFEGGLYHRRRRPARLGWGHAGIAFLAWIGFVVIVRELVIARYAIPSSSMTPTLEIGDHILVGKLPMSLRAPERGEVIVFEQPCTPDRDYIMRVVALARETVEVRCGIVYVNGAPVPATLVKERDRYRERYEGRGEGRDEWSERDVSRYRETIGDHTFEVFHDPEMPARASARAAGDADDRGDSRDFPADRPPSCGGERRRAEAEAPDQSPGEIVETDPAPASACKPQRHYVVPEGHVFVLGDNRENSNDSRYWGSVPVDNIKGALSGVFYPLGRVGRVR